MSLHVILVASYSPFYNSRSIPFIAKATSRVIGCWPVA
jgi:hypothetical protein